MIPIPAASHLGRDFDRSLPPIPNGRDVRGSFDFGSSASFDDGFSPSTMSRPMSIRGSDDLQGAPPPLPPPRYVPIAGATPAPPNERPPAEKEYQRDPPSHGSSFDHLSFERRPNPHKHDLDEGYQSLDTARSPIEYPFISSGLDSMKNYDRSMLNKLDARRTRSPPRQVGLSASTGDNSAHHAFHPQPSHHSLPLRTKFLDTTNGFTKSPVMMSAISPRANPFSHGLANSPDYRSPAGAENNELERSPLARGRRTNSGSMPDDITVSTQGSQELGREDEGEFPMEMRSLNIEDPWRERERPRECFAAAGQKRRASSPLVDEFPAASDATRRRDGGALSRGSPMPRLTVISQGSISSVSSTDRSGVYSSLASGSIASMTPFGQRSPNSVSPGGISPTDPSSCNSPFTGAPLSLLTSPGMTINRDVVPPQPPRSLSDLSSLTTCRPLASRKLVEIPKNASTSSAVVRLKDPFMCQCCPKKPKKFDTQEELVAHAAEKQFTCLYCGSRFKNKNEAERHQNSLHVRRHSWSCSALTGYERAFHDSTNRPGDADVCGYCGQEFNRTGPLGGPNQCGRFVSEQDWEDRIRHLQDVHKFRECNASKKFYRADHFRQHLKHSHAGTSGKWTNMLENACMVEEDPPTIGGR